MVPDASCFPFRSELAATDGMKLAPALPYPAAPYAGGEGAGVTAVEESGGDGGEG